MRGRTLDDRGAEGPNLFAVVVIDPRFGVEEQGRVLEISLCFRRLSGGVPLEEEVPVMPSQPAVSTSGQGGNESLLAEEQGTESKKCAASRSTGTVAQWPSRYVL